MKIIPTILEKREIVLQGGLLAIWEVYMGGLHFALVYNKIEKEKHCKCRPWPGVTIETTSATTSGRGEDKAPLSV